MMRAGLTLSICKNKEKRILSLLFQEVIPSLTHRHNFARRPMVNPHPAYRIFRYVRNHGWIPWRHEASRWTLAVDGARAVWVRIAKTMADGVEEKARKRRMRLARAELARNEVLVHWVFDVFGVCESLLSFGLRLAFFTSTYLVACFFLPRYSYCIIGQDGRVAHRR